MRFAIRHALGVAVVDNFLSGEALESIRHFSLQSTIWFANRYGYGRLGAFFQEGFNCPLLVQIAQELSAALPRVIGSHRFQQLWGFKYGNVQPQTSAHADFAAVNVNFWITPDSANLDGSSGGLLLYDVEAPLDWDFESYNSKGQKIDAFLQARRAGCTSIPYRSNRAIIFKSNIFHATAPFKFADGYENRRINVTMLYGSRERYLRSVVK